MAGSELAVVARAGTAVLRGAVGKAGGSPSWPNFHAALIELHEILDEWVRACTATYDLILSSRGMSPEEIKEAYSHVNVRSTLFPRLSAGFLEQAEKDLLSVMSPPAPVLQRWSRTKRRQAARRTLRSMLKVYCPDVLDEFDVVTADRSAWVRENRESIKRGVKTGLPQTDIARLAAESMQAATDLERIKLELAAVILGRYSMRDGWESL